MAHGKENKEQKSNKLWLGYATFHLGDFRKALEIYEEIVREESDPILFLCVACCQFHLGLFDEAMASIVKAPKSRLQNRIMMFLYAKMKDGKKTAAALALLTDAPEDLLAIAAYHYSKGEFQNSADIYKKLLMQNKDFWSLHVYIALCYYKLDYYDVSMEVLNPYMEKYPDSGIGTNLKACNMFRLQDGLAAELVLKPLLDVMASSPNNFENELVNHNLVVFRGGENALSVLPQLLDVIPEARLNLVIYYLRQGELQLAYQHIKELEPTTPPVFPRFFWHCMQEYVLKGVVHASLVSQSTANLDHSKLAQHYFHLIGNAASECDTIPGRQCMASCYFLKGEFKEVLVYLRSIRDFFVADPTFNLNFGFALAQCGEWVEALEAFLAITNEYFKQEYSYIAWLSKCFIMNGRARDAWELYVRMETSAESVNLLVLIANLCYKVGAFYYAAKAFDLLERMEPLLEYRDGKLGSCAGMFQMVVAGKLKKDCLRDVNIMLRSSIGLRDAEVMQQVIKVWLDRN